MDLLLAEFDNASAKSVVLAKLLLHKYKYKETYTKSTVHRSVLRRV